MLKQWKNATRYSNFCIRNMMFIKKSSTIFILVSMMKCVCSQACPDMVHLLGCQHDSTAARRGTVAGMLRVRRALCLVWFCFRYYRFLILYNERWRKLFCAVALPHTLNTSPKSKRCAPFSDDQIMSQV